MPTLADLQNRFALPGTLSEVNEDCLEEALVCDSRAAMRPAQFVEQKWRKALRLGNAFMAAASADSLRRPKPR